MHQLVYTHVRARAYVYKHTYMDAWLGLRVEGACMQMVEIRWPCSAAEGSSERAKHEEVRTPLASGSQAKHVRVTTRGAVARTHTRSHRHTDTQAKTHITCATQGF